MKIKIHYTINEVEDSIVLEGDTVEDIRKQSDCELLKRGIDTKEIKNLQEYNIWSEEIKQ